ncbi:hypothetical protein Tco_0816151 [Tanacetum coccineum]
MQVRVSRLREDRDGDSLYLTRFYCVTCLQAYSLAQGSSLEVQRPAMRNHDDIDMWVDANDRRCIDKYGSSGYWCVCDISLLAKTRSRKWISSKRQKNRAKMTKLSIEWKRLCKIKAKVQKCQSQSQYRRISSQTGAGTEEYGWMQSLTPI